MTPPSRFDDLQAATAWFGGWMAEAALPLWSQAGVTPAGAFVELLTPQGQPVAAPHRARVQARQTFVFASAARAGFGARWLATAQRGMAFYRAHFRGPDGLFVFSTDAEGQVVDSTAYVYEQAFSLLALAALHAADPSDRTAASEADRILRALEPRRHPAGGFKEAGATPFQANAHMHLLESALAWEAADGGAGWTRLADEIVTLARSRFIGPPGVLREFFDAAWRPAPGAEGRMIEPGHHFEWAWLLERWGRARGEADARDQARALFDAGMRGVDPARPAAVNGLWDDFSPRDPAARLWPQTEYLRAALLFGRPEEALRAASGLARYLDTPAPGAWRDWQLADGSFAPEPAPASSFYHLMGAVLELKGVA